MQTKKIPIIFLLILNISILLPGQVMAQSVSNNTGIEKYIDRPLTLHKNNFEFAFGYQFGALLSVFDNNDKKINLSDAGIAASNQTINFQFDYGVTERFQVQASIINYTYKKTTALLLQNGLGNTQAFTSGIETSKGFFDPRLGVNYQLLGKDKKVQISIGGGVSIPIAKYKPETPEIDTYIGNYKLYQLKYKLHNGSGTPVYNVNLALKYRLGSLNGSNLASKIIARLVTNYYTAPSAVSSNEWQYVFDVSNPNGYVLQSLPEKQKKGDWLDNKLYIDYQPFNITSFMLGASTRYYFHGWYQINSLKIAEYDASESSLLVGAHIQATPRLRIDELVTLPISGINTESFFQCQLALIYKIL